MSHVPEDDEVKRILAMTDSDDSKGKNNPKKDVTEQPPVKDKVVHKNDEFNEYDEDDRDPLEHKEMDDKEW